MVRKNLPLLRSFLRFDRKCSEFGPPLITKAGSAPDKKLNIKIEYKYIQSSLLIFLNLFIVYLFRQRNSKKKFLHAGGL